MLLDPELFGPDQPCFGCAPNHPTGFRLTFAREGDSVVTYFTPGQLHQGPPGIMHGGLVLTLADEIGAWTIIGVLEKFGFTAQVSGKLKRPVRLGAEVVGRGRVSSQGTRSVRVAVTLDQGSECVFEGEIAFVLVDASGAERLLGQPIPDAWRRFCR